jgi:hypothetical protein
MILTPTEAIVVQLPRVPAATYAQYKVWTPAVFILLVAYYVLYYNAPDVIKGLGFFFVAVPFLLIVSGDFASLCLSQDEDGKRVPFAKRIAAFKEVFDVHDYNYFLIYSGRKLAKKRDIPIDASPEEIQKAIREGCAIEPSSGSTGFHVQQLEEVQFKFYSKDGNQDNHSPENRGLKVRKPQGRTDFFRVLVIPDEPEKESREIEISTSLVEKHAEKYLSTHTKDDDLTFRKIISCAINQTVIETSIRQVGPLLQRSVEAGQEHRVEELLKQDVDVNERAEYGWTALLYAAAQGYPRIVRLLLDAGANIDMGNLQGITPLMYSARYGNIEICELLLEYGANPDLQDVFGMTALMVAARLGYADVVATLLKTGTDVSIKDRNNMRALDFAQKYKQGRIARMIRTAKNRRGRHSFSPEHL